MTKAKPTELSGDDPNESIAEGNVGIGENADGTFNAFLLSQLAEKTAERDREEQAQEYAAQQSEAGFPDEAAEGDEDDDLSDLDELDEIISL